MSKGSYTKEELQRKVKMLEEENIKLRKELETEGMIRDRESNANFNMGLAEGRHEALELVKSILQTIAWYGITGHQDQEEE